MKGFRYVLELPDGDLADPVFFNSAFPPDFWKPGDQFSAASDLRRFRILEIRELEERGGEQADGVWAVEPVHTP